jgi:hypothetical protein
VLFPCKPDRDTLPKGTENTTAGILAS